MAEIFKNLKTRIALRTGDYAYWTTGAGKDLELFKGEVCICTVAKADNQAQTAPTVLFKVADANGKKFADLDWCSAKAADVYDWAKKSQEEFITWVNTVVEHPVITTGSVNGTIAVDGTDVAVKGLGSAAYTDANAYATSAENGANAAAAAAQKTIDNYAVAHKDDYTNKQIDDAIAAVDTGVHAVTLTGGTNNGTVKLTVDNTETDNIAVTGLKDAAYVTVESLNATAKGYADAVETGIEDGTIKAKTTEHADAAGKVDKALTVKVGGADVVFDGSVAKTADVDAAIAAAIEAEGHPEYSIAKVATTTGYSATYQLTKDGTAVGTKIDIPKDMVVSKGEVVTYSTSGAWGKAGTYIALTLANATSDTLYIPVDGLIEYVTSGSTADSQVIVAIDETTHKVTATIGAGKIGATELAQTVKDDIAEGVTAHGWGNHASAGYLKSGDISGKADKKVPAAAGNLASLDANGNLEDSGKKIGDFATSSQGTKADNALQEVEVGEGLKVSAKASNKQKIEIDTDVIFVLNANF